MKRLLVAVLLGALFLALAGCAPPAEGTRITIPDETKAYQVKYDRSGLTTCELPSQEVTITRNTYWESSLGSQGSIRFDISEVSVSNYGSCETTKGVFISDETLNDLIGN
ncbi:MAG: hypothetical protein ACOYUB_00705 [Patescibacteria group bacterium]